MRRDEFFYSFLQELAEALSFPSLVPDNQGACLLHFHEKDHSILFEFDDQLVPNTILMSSPLCLLPEENRLEILESCLKGNQEMDETLSCKPDDFFLYLHRRVYPGIQAAALTPVINAFLSKITLWKEKIAAISKKPPNPHRFPLPPSTFSL